MPTNCNTILKWLQYHKPVATTNHTYYNNLVHCIIGTYCNHFLKRLQYDAPMATKLVVLQSCGVALEIEPCSVACPSFSFSHYMWELCLCLMKRLLLDPSCVTFQIPLSCQWLWPDHGAKSSMLWRMVIIIAYFFCGSTKMIFLMMSASSSFNNPIEWSSLIIRFKRGYISRTSSSSFILKES